MNLRISNPLNNHPITCRQGEKAEKYVIVVGISEGFFTIACSMNRHIINPPYQVRNRKKERYVIIGAVNALIDVIIHKIMGKRK